jgi:hypothetical protein
MKKHRSWISLLLAGCLATCSLQAQEDDMEEEPEILPQAKQVGKASEDSIKTASSFSWQNIALAGVVTTAAVITLILVAKNR